MSWPSGAKPARAVLVLRNSAHVRRSAEVASRDLALGRGSPWSAARGQGAPHGQHGATPTATDEQRLRRLWGTGSNAGRTREADSGGW